MFENKINFFVYIDTSKHILERSSMVSLDIHPVCCIAIAFINCIGCLGVLLDDFKI